MMPNASQESQTVHALYFCNMYCMDDKESITLIGTQVATILERHINF